MEAAKRIELSVRKSFMYRVLDSWDSSAIPGLAGRETFDRGGSELCYARRLSSVVFSLVEHGILESVSFPSAESTIAPIVKGSSSATIGRCRSKHLGKRPHGGGRAQLHWSLVPCHNRPPIERITKKSSEYASDCAGLSSACEPLRCTARACQKTILFGVTETITMGLESQEKLRGNRFIRTSTWCVGLPMYYS